MYRVEKDNNIYATKVFSDSFFLEEYKSERNRITNEIAALKSVDSKYLVKYYDDFNLELETGLRTHIIIMEFVTGTKLTNVIYKNSNENEMIEIFKEVLLGVKELHSYNIIHRDLKPDNILITSNGNVKIIDYGLAKLIDFSSITRTGASMGSPMYMSPEQIHDSKHINFTSDIYSLGVILYQMITKKYPYQVTSYDELIYKIINTPIVSPKEYKKDISSNLEKIIYKALSKKIYDRYQTIDEFYSAFDNNIIKNNVTKSCYYAWLYNEKTPYEIYENKDSLKCIFPIHLRDWQKGLFKYMCDHLDNVIIDPSTQRYSYATFSKVSGLLKLAYCPKTGVMDLNYLNSKANRESYIENWYKEIYSFKKVILPYHYISNTNYRADKIEEWIKINVQLINESVDRINIGDKIFETYAMISIKFDSLVYERERLLSYYVNLNVDKYIVQVSNMKDLNVQNVSTYIEFIEQLQNSTGKDVIALKVL